MLIHTILQQNIMSTTTMPTTGKLTNKKVSKLIAKITNRSNGQRNDLTSVRALIGRLQKSEKNNPDEKITRLLQNLNVAKAYGHVYMMDILGQRFYDVLMRAESDMISSCRIKNNMTNCGRFQNFLATAVGKRAKLSSSLFTALGKSKPKCDANDERERDIMIGSLDGSYFVDAPTLFHLTFTYPNSTAGHFFSILLRGMCHHPVLLQSDKNSYSQSEYVSYRVLRGDSDPLRHDRLCLRSVLLRMFDEKIISTRDFRKLFGFVWQGTGKNNNELIDIKRLRITNIQDVSRLFGNANTKCNKKVATRISNNKSKSCPKRTHKN